MTQNHIREFRLEAVRLVSEEECVHQPKRRSATRGTNRS